MVDVVNAVSLQSSALRSGSQNAAVSVSAEPVQSSQPDFVSSSIHIDNLQNVAILEYRSSRTGELIQRYPTQAQIDAFKRVSAHTEIQQAQTTPAVAPQPVAAAPSAPAPAPAEAPAPSSGDEGTSVLV
jgi:hypothetical protein